MEDKKQTVDITDWNRKERRKLRRQIKLTVKGRNLPYQKQYHGTPENFYALREKERAEANKV